MVTYQCVTDIVTCPVVAGGVGYELRLISAHAIVFFVFVFFLREIEAGEGGRGGRQAYRIRRRLLRLPQRRV